MVKLKEWIKQSHIFELFSCNWSTYFWIYWKKMCTQLPASMIFTTHNYCPETSQRQWGRIQRPPIFIHRHWTLLNHNNARRSALIENDEFLLPLGAASEILLLRQNCHILRRKSIDHWQRDCGRDACNEGGQLKMMRRFKEANKYEKLSKNFAQFWFTLYFLKTSIYINM
jgi:hypothetical protein